MNLLVVPPVLLRLERGSNGRPQVFDESGDPVTVLHAHALRERNRSWPMWLLEVMDVTPIARKSLGCRLFFEKPANNRVLAGPRRPEREKVVPMAAHTDTKLNRGDRTVLAEYQGAVGQLCSRCKG